MISVDSAVAHLAGAMGKPVFLMLPFAADFRWLRERQDSPWYPTARLYRQAEFGNWDSVIGALRQQLQPRAETFYCLRRQPAVSLTFRTASWRNSCGLRRELPEAASFRNLRYSYTTRIPGSQEKV